MLGDVLAVATSVGETWVVSPEPVEGATWIPDPGGGQGAAVGAALRGLGPGPVLVVNSDLPTLTADDLRALHAAIPERGIAIAAAGDGTTNALGSLGHEPLRAALRAGQRRSLRAHAIRRVDRAGPADDVDTLADLRLGVGPRRRPRILVRA